MQAAITKIKEIIEGTKQYVVPLFQRTYCWEKKDWEVLWKDLVELCEMENPRMHFFGSIVNMPTISVSEGVTKYFLIDGQQRLTTVFILLILLRNNAKENNDEILANEINDVLLINKYEKEGDYYKLMPTQKDREAYQDLIQNSLNKNDNQLTNAYIFFKMKLKQIKIEPRKLLNIITKYFSVVSVVLGKDDNEHLVFESLNAKGVPLAPSDLIRNYFFMRIHVDEQKEIYKNYWLPMETALKEDLTEFIWHYLMKDGDTIRLSDIYYTIKENISKLDVVEYLKELNKYSFYYQKFKYPEFEKEPELKKCLLN